MSFNCNGQLYDYPKEIKSLGIEKLFDKTKWYLYCITSDQKLDFTVVANHKGNVTYGTLPIKFDHLEVRGTQWSWTFSSIIKMKR